jgi:hypothetical protein
VIWCEDRESAVSIEVHFTQLDDVVSARIVGPNEILNLHDDGTHGDVAAGDGVFSISDVRPYCARRFSLKFDKSLATWYGTLEVTLSDGRTLEDSGSVRIGLVNPKFLLQSDVTVLGDGITMTSNVLFIEDSAGAIFDGYPVFSTAVEEVVRAACERLYHVMPDDFDFVLIMSGMRMFEAAGYEEIVATTVRVSNDIEGIGLSLFDRTKEFSSAGRLQAAMVHSFGGLDLADRELMQRWGAGLGTSLGLALETTGGSLLWSPLSDIGGQLSAYYVSESGEAGRFADNGDGTWRLAPVTDNEVYSPLELYIMGLIPADEVPPIHLLSYPNVSDPERVTAESVRTIKIDDILGAAGGARRPSSEDAPVEFDVAFVVVQDVPFTDADYAYYSLLSYELAFQGVPLDFDLYSPFYWATGNRGSLNTSLPLPLLGDEGAALLVEP